MGCPFFNLFGIACSPNYTDEE